MTWVSVLGAILYYTAYPVTTLFWLGIRLLRLVLSPITAFFQFIIALISFPFKWLARFEVGTTGY